VCGDMLSAFDFASPNNPVPRLPDTKGSATLVAQAKTRPKPMAPAAPEKLFQEPGIRFSRALPYALHVEASVESAALNLTFRNEGRVGAVFHVYDRMHLDRIPRRYTVEAGHSLTGRWEISKRYDLWVLGPNGFVRAFAGDAGAAGVNAALAYLGADRAVELRLTGSQLPGLMLESRVYGPPVSRRIKAGATLRWDVSKSGNWYDFTLTTGRGFARRFAGRLETGKDGVSDPAMDLG
jgi:phospholipase C